MGTHIDFLATTNSNPPGFSGIVGYVGVPQGTQVATSIKLRVKFELTWLLCAFSFPIKLEDKRLH